ncbi:hypothetical protein [Kiloniella sp. EL199]|uniref:hypothetical protein n=1 Tax=Kiloniella sp. EL199 TaxID=2107581 RepID=UPI000EA2EE53|nr:hypothetical protein [Kiloniella sp. EL199]
MNQTLIPSNALTLILGLSPDIRYAAISQDGAISMQQREGLDEASAAESDRYEEALVNPVLLTLARARGEIDCGGLSFIVVGYGNFRQLVVPLANGHVSVCFPHAMDPTSYVDAIRTACGEDIQ